MNDCEFENHSNVQQGGAIHALNGGNFTIESTNFINNQASQKGGALYLKNFLNFHLKSVIFDQNFIKNDQKDPESKGGSIYLEEAQKTEIQNSKFLNSHSFYQGGALFLKSLKQLKINTTEFSNNTVSFTPTTPLEKKDN